MTRTRTRTRTKTRRVSAPGGVPPSPPVQQVLTTAPGSYAVTGAPANFIFATSPAPESVYQTDVIYAAGDARPARRYRLAKRPARVYRFATSPGSLALNGHSALIRKNKGRDDRRRRRARVDNDFLLLSSID